MQFCMAGAGAIISRGAMQRAGFKAVEKYLRGLEPQSGDAMITKAFWNVLGIGPTDPGLLKTYARKMLIQSLDRVQAKGCVPQPKGLKNRV